VRREQHFSEQYSKNKPLCFNAKPFQKTHPKKALKARALGQKDADATLISPMLVAIADGVSQIEEFGIDASELPNELLNALEEQAIAQLLPDQETEEYLGPISMMTEAYEATTCLGSTTILSATMDNSTRIHGKLHPMIAICSIGDCEILVLRREQLGGRLGVAFHTEMQRIDGNAQSPLQLARVDDSIDPNFKEELMIEVIERGSAVHCVSAYEGDIVVLGTDGVFDNLFTDEVVEICNEMLFQPAGKFRPFNRNLLGEVAQRIVFECHAKTDACANGGYRDCPIGRGGKVDDTSCIVGEVVEWTEAHGDAWSSLRRGKWFRDFFTCGGNLPTGGNDEIVIEDKYEYENGARVRRFPQKPNASFSTYWGSFNSATSGNSFSSFTSAYGTAKEGERAFAMYGARPNTVVDRRRRHEDEEEEQGACSLM